MAFAKQYFSSYKSNNNLDYYLEIFVEGFDSSATEISVGAGGPVISYETDQEDRFSPILSSQCVLPFVVKNTSLQAFIQLLRTTYQERQVYLHLYRATSSTYTTTKPIWSGFLVMDLGSGEDVSFPYEQKLTFVDGLSLLKDIDFVDLSNAGSETNIQGSYTQDNMYYGPAIYTFWIKEILAKAGCATTTQGVSIDYGFTTAVNWYNADMQNTNQGSDPLGLTQCVVSMFHNKNDQDVFTPENCYTVLKELLRHWGARITYWKHEFWIVQIPEYIQDESGLIDNPDNINSRQYNRFGTLTGSQDHLGDTYYTRYEQTIQSNQVSKLVGTKYNYLPMIHNAEADFLSFASKNYYGGFPYGVSAESQEIFQGTIIDPSTANFLWLSIPLNWTWDMTGSSLTAGHENGWWCSVRFNFYASDGTTTYYLQYDSSGQGSYYWVLEADWTPLGNTSPKYIIKSRSLTETNYIGFQENIPFVDSSGSAITMTGAWSFFLDIEDFANQSSSGNNGSFYCRFSGYAPSSHYSYVKKDPYQEFPYLPTTSDVSGGGPQTKSGTVRWSNTLENPSGVTTTSFSTPVGFDAGTSQADIQLITTSPFKGLLQTLNTTQTSSFGLSLNTQVNNSTNTETFSFGTLLWGDAIQQFAVGCLRVNNGTAFVKTNPDGEWGRGTLTGTNTFTELLIDEFLSGQIKVVIAPTMRLAVGEENKNQTATGTSGPATRPRYVNPIGRLREFRSNETDPEYIFRRGSFHSLYDEWDYEGYQILRDTVSSTTTTTDIGDLGGTQDNKPISNAKMIGNVNNALMMNSPVAYLRTTVPATGSNVAVNGNFNTAVGWTLGTGWSIDTTAKKAKFAATGSTSELTQSVLTQGLTYQVNFQVVVTAGTLLVKAGTSGTSQSITTSGNYSLYLDCDGSNLIKFQAGTTFTGNITYITLRDQKSISAVPINSIGSTVFKSGDTFNLINSLGGEILPLTVSSNQGATDDTISVTSTALFDDIGIDSVLLINQDDLSAQYQNKTKGTVAGFDITATGIAKSSINITDWLNSDTMSGAAVTNVPTALSVKNYVDAQVGSADTLQEVTDNGNTTTNSIMIGSSSSPSTKLHVVSSDETVATIERNSGSGYTVLNIKNGVNTTGNSVIRFSDTTASKGAIDYEHADDSMRFNTNASERMRLTSAGNLLIGTTTTYYAGTLLGVGDTSDSQNGLQITTSTTGNGYILFGDGTGADAYRGEIRYAHSTDTLMIKAGGTNILNLTGTTATFSGQVTIPATPVASTDAASKGYVDAHGGGLGPFLPLTGGTLTGSLTGTTATFIDGNTTTLTLNRNNSETTYLTTLSNYYDASLGTALKSGTFNILTHGNSLGTAINFTNGNLKFNFRNAEKARITDGGNVLIGTTTDSGDKLQVNGSITGTTGTFGTLKVTTGLGSAAELQFTNAGAGLYRDSGNLVLAGYDNIVFKSSNDVMSSQSERMRLTSGGNLLIGTTTDSGDKLFVDGNIKITDNSFLSVGTSADLVIYHDSNNSYIQNAVGSLYIRNDADDKDIVFVNDDGSGGVETYFYLDGSSGGSNPATVFPDNSVLYFGNGTDFKFKHNGTNSYVENETGDLYITQDADDKDIIIRADDGAGGITPYITLDGSLGHTTVQKAIKFLDDTSAFFGNSQDLEIVHTGNHSYMFNNTGNLTISNRTDGSDIIFKTDNGTNGTTSYITLDGSQTTINLQQSVLIGTTTNSGVYKLDVFGKARVQSVFELDDVLTLNQISTPADPQSGQSSIYMDSADGAIKVKINVGGTVVTRTIASFE